MPQVDVNQRGGLFGPPKSVNASKLNQRVMLQSPTDAPDGQGGVVRTWSTIPGCDEIPAQIVFIVTKKGGESYQYQQVYASSMIFCSIRYMPEIPVSDIDRLVWGNKIYNIRDVNIVDADFKQINMTGEELQATGAPTIETMQEGIAA